MTYEIMGFGDFANLASRFHTVLQGNVQCALRWRLPVAQPSEAAGLR